MHEGQPSRTSILVAAARAFGAREPDPSVRNPDFLAERFLGEDERQLIAGHPISSALSEDYQQARQKVEVSGISNMMVARTRFIDEHLQRAVDKGATQIVILGAGFDTRAYRFSELLDGAKVFEVDFAATQEIKKRRVAEVLGGLPDNVVYVEIDFKRDTLRDVLRDAGYHFRQESFFIWEGVSMYLSEDAVRETLQTIASSSLPGSSLVMDFAGSAIIELLDRFPNNPQHRFTTGWGEPWIFGLPDSKEREFFQDCGLELRETMMLFGGEVSKRYLTRADGTKLGPRRGRRTPDSSSQESKLTRFLNGLKMMAVFAGMLLTRRSKWYAMAELVVPEALD